MAAVRVVTDSAADLTDELVARSGITVVPLIIRFGDEELLDRRELSPEEFWRRCKISPSLPETAAPPPGAFRSAFEQAADEGATGVVCLTISAGLSATYQAAVAGAEALGGRFPVEVVDSRSVTMGQGLLAMAAADLGSAGRSPAEVAAGVRELTGRTKVFGIVDTLDHLQRGGRIGGAAALLGSLLSIKPVIEMRDGVVEQESKQRTRSRALEYIVTKVAAAAPFDRLAVCDGSAPDIGSIAARVNEIGADHEPVVVDLGPAVGTHAGPGTIGICYIRRGPAVAGPPLSSTP